jgi:hypothetical protein
MSNSNFRGDLKQTFREWNAEQGVSDGIPEIIWMILVFLFAAGFVYLGYTANF